MPGIYALRGTELDRAVIESRGHLEAMPRRALGNGWSAEDRPWVAVILSSSALRRGIISVPSTLRLALQGEWRIELVDGQVVGTLKVHEQAAWGLRAAFLQLGSEPESSLILEWKLSERRVLLVPGSEEALLAFREGRAAFWFEQGR